jgi:aminopeptidase YwaD
LLNINIDGAGYFEGVSAYSLFELPEKMDEKIREVMQPLENFVEGPQWPQGDHSIFVQFGCPAVAFTSQWFLDNMSTQRITHTPEDHPRIINLQRPVEIASAICTLIAKLE